MGTAYIRLKFTPIVKYFPKANSNNCWLEIIPTVSCIKNLDKIEWSQQNGSVEYIVPMTYKIIFKKREPEHQLKVYYSCIDLLSSVSSLDLSAGDVHRHLSDHFILSKGINENSENRQDFDLKINCRKHDVQRYISDHFILSKGIKENSENKQDFDLKINCRKHDVQRHISDHFILSKGIDENSENRQDFDLKINCRKHDINASDKVSDVPFSHISKVKQTKNENVQVTDNSEYTSIENDGILNEKQTETENKIDKSFSNIRCYAVSHVNSDNKNKENLQKKLCVTKVCEISTDDEISLRNNYVTTDFITTPSFKPSTNRLDLNNIQNKNIKCMENIYRPVCHSLLNCFVRVEPKIRVAEFVENMEKEVFPLKVLLNDILKKCTTLGLKKSISSNVSGVNKYVSLKNKCCNKTLEVQKQLQSNRIVYSIVFDS